MRIKFVEPPENHKGSKVGDERECHSFLFLPKATRRVTPDGRVVNGNYEEVRWLEDAIFKQKYVEWSDGTRSWLTTEWLSV